MSKRGAAVFTIYYAPMESPKVSRSMNPTPKRSRSPYMVGCCLDDDTNDWAPGVQRTLLGAIWAAWRTYRRLSRGTR